MGLGPQGFECVETFQNLLDSGEQRLGVCDSP